MGEETPPTPPDPPDGDDQSFCGPGDTPKYILVSIVGHTCEGEVCFFGTRRFLDLSTSAICKQNVGNPKVWEGTGAGGGYYENWQFDNCTGPMVETDCSPINISVVRSTGGFKVTALAYACCQILSLAFGANSYGCINGITETQNTCTGCPGTAYAIVTEL